MTTEHSIAAHWHGGFEEAALQAFLGTLANESDGE